MKILIVEPMKSPRRADIPHSLGAMQQAVGGYIEAVYPFDDPVVLVCDEEGKLKDKPPNLYIPRKDIIVGTFFLCGQGEEDFTDLPDELMDKYEKMFTKERMYFRTKMGIFPVLVYQDEDEKGGSV